MKLSHSMGLTAFAALLAASGLASAAAITYEQTGVIVVSDPTCTSFGLAVGSASNSTIYYPGSGMTGMTIASSGTPVPSASATGSTVTNTCVSSDPAPANLKGSTVNFTCYQDKLATNNPAIGLVNNWHTTGAKLVAGQGSISTTNSTSALTVETVSTLMNGLTKVCSYTVDSTWVKK